MFCYQTGGPIISGWAYKRHFTLLHWWTIIFVFQQNCRTNLHETFPSVTLKCSLCSNLNTAILLIMTAADSWSKPKAMC